ADRLRGQVQILDLLELARAVVRRLRVRGVRDGGLGGIGAGGGTAGRTRRIGGRHQRLEGAAGFLTRLWLGGADGTPGQVIPVRGVVPARFLPGRGGTARLVAGVPVDVHVGGCPGRRSWLGGAAEARRPGPA